MVTIDELRSRGAAARTKFRAALTAAPSRWDELLFHQDPGVPRPEERSSWSPRDVAEHALSSERLNLGIAARITREHISVDILELMKGLTDFDWGNRSYSWIELTSADAAVRELGQCEDAWDELLTALDDSSLEIAAGMVEGSVRYMELRGLPVTKTIGGLLVFCTEHMVDHADQIAEGVS